MSENKYIETATDKNVEGKEFYLGDVSDNPIIGRLIYRDENHTELATIDELIHYYNMNDLILVAKTPDPNPDNASPVRSRVNVIVDASADNQKVCMLMYHLINTNAETSKPELTSEFSLVVEEL